MIISASRVPARRLALLVSGVSLALLAPALVAVPARAAEAPSLVSTSIEVVDQSGVPSIATTFHLAGEVGGVWPVWAHEFADGTRQTVSSGGYSVNPGLSMYTLSFLQKPSMAQGLWVLDSVRVESFDGLTSVSYGRGAALPIPGTLRTFTVATGPTTWADVAALSGTVTSATLVEPSGAPKTVDGPAGVIKADLAIDSPTGDSQYAPVWALDGTAIRKTPSGYGVLAGASTLHQTLAASSLGYNGTWRLEGVLIRTGPVVRIYRGDGTVDTLVQTDIPLNTSPRDCAGYVGDLNPAYGVTAGCLKLPSSTHTVTGLGADASSFTATGLTDPPGTGPRLSAATRSVASVAAGGTVTWTATYTDAALPPKVGDQLAVIARDSAGNSLSRVSTTSTGCVSAPYSCTVSATYSVSPDIKPGLLTITDFYSYNSAAHVVDYQATDWTWKTWGPSVHEAYGPGDPSPSLLGVTVLATAGADVTPPTLLSFTRTSPPTADSADPIAATYAWTGTDGTGGGIAEVQVRLLDPVRNQHVYASWQPTPPATSGTSGVIELPGQVAGDYVVRGIVVTDRAGNKREYDADGTVVPGTRHALDLASGAITLLDGTVVSGVPSAPRGLAVSGRDQTLVVGWLPPAEAGTFAVSSYDVTLEPSGITQHVTTPSATFTGLTNGFAYAVTVRANNTLGAGPIAWAPGVAVRPVAPLVGPGLAAVPLPSRSSTLVLTATTPAPQLGAPVTGYLTQIRAAMPGTPLPATWTDYGAVRAVPSGLITRLSLGARVCVRIVAVNAVGRGAGSNVRCTVVLGDERSLTASTGWTRRSVTSAYQRTLSTSLRTGSYLTIAKAYGSTLLISTLAVPGGGTFGVYVGNTRVAVLSAAALRATYRTTLLKVATKGQRVTLRVLTTGRAGVTFDGFAVGA